MKRNRSESSRTRNNVLFGLGLTALAVLAFCPIELNFNPAGLIVLYKGLWDVSDAEYYGRYAYKEKYYGRPWFSRFHRLDGAGFLSLGLLMLFTQYFKNSAGLIGFFGILTAICLFMFVNWYYHCVCLENKSEIKE